MKKILCFMLVLILTVSSAICVSAAETDEKEVTIDGAAFSYRVLADNTVEILRGEKFIPKEIEGLPVTVLGEDSFARLNDLKGEVPDTVTYIGDGAFRFIENMKTIEIPDSVAYIGVSAFEGCESLAEVRIPSGITQIADRAFADCWALKKVELNEGLRIIGYCAFAYTGVKNIKFPSSLRFIDQYAFISCGEKKFDFSDVSQNLYLADYSIGYYGDFSEGNLKPQKGITVVSSPKAFRAADYAFDNSFKSVVKMTENEVLGSRQAPSGSSFYLSIQGTSPSSFELPKYSFSDPTAIKLTSDGKIAALKKGNAYITATDKKGNKYTFTVYVYDNPRLLNKVGGKYKAASSVSVRQGKTVTLSLRGRAAEIKNKYTSTSGAKIVSKADSDSIKIKGIKKGTSTVKIKVNGVKTFKVKVKVI